MFNIKIESKEVKELKDKIEELKEELAKARLDKELNTLKHGAQLDLIKEEREVKFKLANIDTKELLTKKEAEINSLKQLLETERNFHKTNIETINKNMDKIETTYKKTLDILKDSNTGNDYIKHLIEALPKVNISSISPDIKLNNNNR